jgi:hypothetical protein
MTNRHLGRLLCLLSLFVPGSSALVLAQPRHETFTGKVVELKEALKKTDLKLDDDIGLSLVLLSSDGKIYPLLKDAGSRRFYRDAKLRNREVRITGRKIGEPGFLQVLSMVGLKDKQVLDLYYWCDICAIRRTDYSDMCECCGGPMTFREEPLP